MRILPLALLCAAFHAALAADFQLSSPDFPNGGRIPERCTCQGRNVPPVIEITGVPPGAQSLVLIVDDPDAPSGTFTHWLLWDIPAGTRRLSASTLPAGSVQGTNDFGTAGYSGPCPPSGIHRYFFRLSALRQSLALPPGSARDALDSAIKGRVLATAVLMGRYSKSPQ